MIRLRTVLVLTLGAWVAVCAGAAPITINLWHTETSGDRKQGMDNIVALYEKMYPGVTVTQNSQASTPYLTAIRTALFGGGSVDVFKTWAGSRASEIADAGLAVPLDNVWKDAKLDSLYGKSLSDASTYDGKKYYVPFMYRYDPLLWYLPSTLQKAGVTQPPKTWAEFEAMLKALKAKGIYPFAIGNKSAFLAPYFLEPLLIRTAGMDFYNQLLAGKASFTDPRVRKAFEIWKGWMDAGYFFPDANAYEWTDLVTYWQKGETAFILMNDAALTNLPKDVQYLRFPQYSNDMPLGDTMQLYLYGVSQNTKYLKESQNFVKLMASVEGQVEYLKASPSLMANPKIPASLYLNPLHVQMGKDFTSTAMSVPIDMGPPQSVGMVAYQVLQAWFTSPTMETAQMIMTKLQAAMEGKK